MNVAGALISVCTVLVLVGAGLAVCFGCDHIERKWRLKRLRRAMLSEPDVSDKEFAAAFTEMEVAHVLEMRQMLAALLGIDPRKIRAEWRFREERHLKNMDLFILEAFVDKYAPDKLRDHHSFVFPANNVSTVRDLFLEVGRLKGNG